MRAPIIGFDQLDEGVLEVGWRQARAGVLGLQSVGRAERDQLALVDDADPVAVLRLFHEVGRDQDRDAGRRHGVDSVPERAPHDRVDAGGRLVEEQDARLVHDRAGEREPLLVAERQLGADGRGDVAQAERVDGLRCLLLRRAPPRP